jgi:hypothetical protein
MTVRPSCLTPAGATRTSSGWSPRPGCVWWRGLRRPPDRLGGASAKANAPGDLGELIGQHEQAGGSPMRSITGEAVNAASGGNVPATVAVAAVGGGDGEVLWHQGKEEEVRS